MLVVEVVGFGPAGIYQTRRCVSDLESAREPLFESRLTDSVEPLSQGGDHGVGYALTGGSGQLPG